MDEKDKSRYLGDVEYFSAKLEQDPSSLLFIPLARAYIKLDKYDEAVQVLTAGIDANSDVVSAKTMLARAYLGQGKVDDAKALLTEVQVIDRGNYLASKLMGDIQRSEDDIKKALINYRSALMIAPEDLELKNLVEELMSAAGIAAHELEEEFSLMDADDEMLDKLGSELAEEVRQEVGVAELGTEEASEDVVSRTIDDIVGGRSMGDDEDDEMSLDKFEEDGEFGEELEEELVASFDDEITPTDLSADSDEPSIVFDKEIMEAGEGEEIPDEDAVRALAAELGADLGLEHGEIPEPEPDELDEALDKVMSEDVDGMDFFEGASEEAESVDEDALLKELSGVAPDEKPKDEVAEALAELEAGGDDQSGEVDDVADALAQLEAEQKGDVGVDFFDGASDEPEDIDSDALLKELSGDVQAEEPGEPEDDVAAAMAELEAGQPDESENDMTVQPAEEESDYGEAAEAQDFNQLQEMPESAEADKPAETAEAEAETGGIFEASMDELLETGPEPEEAEDTLTPETREQVNRLENLLEIIKNNSSN